MPENQNDPVRDSFKAIVAPPLIGWISSRRAAGEIDLAPYSWLYGCRARGELKAFVCNFPIWELHEQARRRSHAASINKEKVLGRRRRGPRGHRGSRHRPARPNADGCRSLTGREERARDRHIVLRPVIGGYDRFIRDGLLL
jgi:hypothetical protein